jgi:hypothetical protein
MTPDRNDFSKMADAYAHILYLDGQAEDTIKTILDKKEQGLSQKDYTLLLYLVKYQTRAGVFKSQDALDCLINHVEIPGFDTMKIIAGACNTLGRQSQANQYYRWMWIYLMMSSARSEMTFDLYNEWMKNSKTKDMKILEIAAPWIKDELFNEIEPDYESRKTRFIATWYDDKAYQKRMKAVGDIVAKHEFETAYSAMHCDMLRYCLLSDKPDVFTANFNSLLRTQATVTTGDTIVDFSSVISRDIPAQRLDKYIVLIKDQINRLYEQNVITENDIVRNLALLAAALKDNGYPSQAERVLNQIYPLKKDLGMVSLWVSDALRQCGRIEQADQIDRQLIQNGSMPKIRIKKQSGQ